MIEFWRSLGDLGQFGVGCTAGAVVLLVLMLRIVPRQSGDRW